MLKPKASNRTKSLVNGADIDLTDDRTVVDNRIVQ